MDEQHRDPPPPKPKRTPPSRKGKGPTPSSWKPGQSGNPGGRPRRAMAFADRVRERIDPDKVIDLALRVAEDERLTPQERLRELWPLIDRGFVKPPTHLDTTVREGDPLELDVSKLSDERLRAILADLEACRVDAPPQQAESASMGQQPDGVTVDDLPPSRPPCHGGAA